MDGHTVNEVFFTDVAVPAANVVGGVGDAWHRLMRGLSVERLIIAAMSIGAARRSVEGFHRLCEAARAVRPFARQLPGGAAPARRPGRRDRLLPRYVYQVAAQIDAGLEGQLAREGSIAKLKCTEIAKQAALEVCN